MFIFLKKYPTLYRVIASYFLIHFVSLTFVPTIAYAITSGPSQPETQAFKPMGASDMVDLFSGDFSYNIPLFELPGPNGGYPFNLSYHGSPSMDEEASWVGLGWNLNVGAINRSVRGLPDEFDGNKGDAVYKFTTMEMNKNYELTFSPLDVELSGGPFFTSIGAKFSISYNNSFGYNVGANVDVTALKVAASFAKKELSAGYTLGLGVDTGSGVTISKGFNLSVSGKSQDAKQKGAVKNWVLGGSGGYNQTISSRNGLLSESLNLNVGTSYKKLSFGVGGSHSLYRAGSSYPPSVDMPMRGLSGTFDLKFGKALSTNVAGLLVGASNGFAASLTIGTETLRDDGGTIKFLPFGYLNLQEADLPNVNQEQVMIDVNREKDRTIRKSNKYLATSNLMPDNYSLSGQGIGGTFRAFRQDIGFSRDNNSTNTSTSGNTGMTLSPGVGIVEMGTSSGVNHNESTSGAWNNDNPLKGNGKFAFKKSNPLKTGNTRFLDENIYFKLYGENTIKDSETLAKIGDGDAWKPTITSDRDLQDKISMGAKVVTATELMAALPKNREKRNTYIQAISNEMIVQAAATPTNSAQALTEYQISYINANGALLKLNRSDVSKYPAHHIGGFTAQNTDGTRYIYALPIYNNVEVEHNYSIHPLAKTKQEKTVLDKSTAYDDDDRTENYKSEQKTTRYPYAYMLTGILGADYVDADNIPGPSDGDVGYWVKFEYQKKSENYQWRAPFVGANYIKGQYNVIRDDKAAFTFGSKEIYYLYTAETSSHIAVFKTSARLDGYGVAVQEGDYGVNYLQGQQYKLEKIKLYSKMELLTKGELATTATLTKPITTTHLSHTYELCKGVLNNINKAQGITEESGKLTLKRITFSYENNSRGKLSPYEFSYTTSQNPVDVLAQNPNYDTHSIDRWGTYKKLETSKVNGEEDLNNYFDFPYAIQDKNYPRDAYAGAWSLKEVKLPSGASIEVNYESDDYAYVQDKKAMQMYEITGIDQPVGLKYNCKSPTPRIYFKLPEEASLLSGGEFDEYLQGFLDNAPVYVKAMVQLKENASSLELISGFIDVDRNKIGSVTHNGQKYAYVQLQANKGYHPLSVAAWQHIQTAQPHIIYQYGDDNMDEFKNPLDIALSMVDIIPDLYKEVSLGYYGLVASKQWGTSISKGWIRLNNRTGHKYGGGARVKRVLIKDNWRVAAGEDAVYGQVYDYTMPNPENPTKRISSGVAAFEPNIGGEENALKYGIKEHTDVISGNSTDYYFEAPINESHYPGPTVGYSQVSVKSLAASALAKETVMTDLAKYFGSRGQFAASGEVVHEFYTAKDFPVISNESPIIIEETPETLLGSLAAMLVSKRTMVAGQGFSIEINDMHGKPKSVSYYAQNEQGQVQYLTPVSWVRYTYQTDTKLINNKSTLVLTNHVPVILSDAQLLDPKGKSPVIKNHLMGVDYDLFADAREYSNYAWSVKTPVKFGLTTTAPWVTNPSFNIFPSPFNSRTDRLQMITFNKIIHRSGILKKTEAFDGGAIVSTENHYWGQNGEVLVTSVDNNFKDKIYTYNIPAYFVYDLTGFAGKGQGLEPTIKVTYNNTTNRYVLNFASNRLSNFKHLFALGDEWIIYGQKADITTDNISPLPNGLPSQKWVVAAINSTSLEFEFTGAYNENFCKQYLATLLYRSGRRNQLSAKVGHVTALVGKQENAQDILFKRQAANCNVTIEKPKCLN